MKYSAIIPCGGVGSRLNIGYNKILYKVNNQYLIEKTLKNFIFDEDCIDIVIVYHKNDYKTLKSLINNSKVNFVEGGSTRAESVLNGLKIAKNNYVLIHDGARPNVSVELINRVKRELENSNSVIPVVKCKDATLINGEYHKNEVLLIQTPQGFKKELLLDAMLKDDISKYRDEGSIIYFNSNIKPSCIDGDYNNIKVTTREDLKYIMED